MANSVVFSRLMEEYGNLEAEENSSKSRSRGNVKKAAETEESTEGGLKKDNAALMQTEERNTGAVTWTVYKNYLRFAGGIIWAPIIVLLLTLTQAAQGVFCLWRPSIPAQPSFSWQQSLPWILDLGERPWLQARRLYGSLCRFGYILLSLFTQIFSNPSVRCCAGRFHVSSQLFLRVSLASAIRLFILC